MWGTALSELSAFAIRATEGCPKRECFKQESKKPLFSFTLGWSSLALRF